MMQRFCVFSARTNEFLGTVTCLDECEAITTVGDHYDRPQDIVGHILYAVEEARCMNAHAYAMFQGRGKDIVELGVIQNDGEFIGWVEDAPGVPRLHRGDVQGLAEAEAEGRVLEMTEIDSDAVDAAIMDWCPWLPMEAGW